MAGINTESVLDGQMTRTVASTSVVVGIWSILYSNTRDGPFCIKIHANQLLGDMGELVKESKKQSLKDRHCGTQLLSKINWHWDMHCIKSILEQFQNYAQIRLSRKGSFCSCCRGTFIWS